MKKLAEISKVFEETIKDSNLQHAATGLTETLTDSILSDGVLKDIPIVGTIIGLGKTALKITDLLFLKKILFFLSELNKVSIDDRKEMIDKIDSSDKYRVKVGEKLLYIIDKCDDYENAQYVSKLFVCFLEDNINYGDFLRASRLIENIYIDDLLEFIDDDRSEIEDEELGNYEGTGLYIPYTEEVEVTDQDDWKSTDKYVVNGGKTKWYITRISQLIRNVLSK
jgi:hypothetical protein